MNEVDDHNENAWDRAAEAQLQWSLPVSSETMEKAFSGELSLKLTATKDCPDQWLKGIKDKKVLVIAGGGGQQVPVLAAAGAEVTLIDISEKQVSIDQQILRRYNLDATLIKGSYKELGQFREGSFDLIINPVSNCFFEDIESFWQDVYRLAAPGANILYGFINPVAFQFDFELANRGIFTLKYLQPYSDTKSLSKEDRKRFIREDVPLEFGHSLEKQIGYPLSLGFSMIGMYEDGWGGNEDRAIDHYLPQFIAVKLVKPEH